MKMITNELMQKFVRTVSEHGQKTAIVSTAGDITYEDLDRESGQLASEIIEICNESDLRLAITKTAILLDHDKMSVMALLGALKAGTTFVPLDVSDPVERLISILKDADARILVTSSDNLELAYKLISKLSLDITIINIDQIENQESKVEDMVSDDAYIIYTSGSSGKPKGVIQPGRALLAATNYLQEEFAIRPQDNMLLTTSFSHTVGLLDIFTALLNGATLYMYNIRSSFDKQHFLRYIEEYKISVVHTVPTFYRFFLKGATASFDSIRLIILGGEEVLKSDYNLYKEMMPASCYFVNLYGQSEVLIGTLNILNKESEIEGRVIPIGFPVEALELKILNEAKEAGVLTTGKLCFRADWIAPKYHGLEEETLNLYTEDSSDSSQWINTGDMGRWLPDGTIEYMGREDHQLKINGNRVHLREIELEIETIPGVENSVVTYNGEKGKEMLCAYAIAEGDITSDKIMRILKEKLPAYMLPKSIMIMEEFPLLPNGKVDRQHMPACIAEGHAPREESIPAELVESLTQIWTEVMGIDNIRPDDNFFQLGGNSLHATEIVNKIYMSHQVDFELSIIFDNQSINDLARTVLEAKQPNKEMA